MGIVDDGYLGLNIDGQSLPIKTLGIMIESITLIVLCGIGFVANRKMLGLRNINSVITGTFLMGFLGAFMASCSPIIWRILVPSHSQITFNICLAIWSFGYIMFMITLLATLILRLYLTFRASVYRISRISSWIFSVILLLLFAAACKITVDIFLIEWKTWLINVYYTVIVWFSLYFIASVSAVAMFIARLGHLAKSLHSHTPSISNSPDTSNVGDIQLDKQQRQLADLAAKYVMLYLIAWISTILSWAISLAVSVESELRLVVSGIDLCVNLWALYLQFSCASDHYEKCCKCCDKRFRGIMRTKTQEMIHKRSLEMHSSITSCSSISGSESPPSI